MLPKVKFITQTNAWNASRQIRPIKLIRARKQSKNQLERLTIWCHAEFAHVWTVFPRNSIPRKLEDTIEHSISTSSKPVFQIDTKRHSRTALMLDAMVDRADAGVFKTYFHPRKD